MPRTSSSYAQVELDAGEEPAPLPEIRSGTPFRMLLMGDFSGRASRGLCEPALTGRRPILVDRDNFDQVFEDLGVELHSMRFRGLDDFHPDRLFDELPVFRSLRDTRMRLENRATFQAAAAEMRSRRPAAQPARPAPPPELAGLKPEDLFARMLDDVSPAPAEARAPRPPDEFDLLLREIVAPYAEPKPDPQQAELVAELDETISAQMRAILHHPEFQAVEAAWRGLFFLVRLLETGTNLKLYILDVSKAELAAALDGKFDESPLFDVIVEHSVGTPGADPWAVLAGRYTFSNSPEDVVLLRELGRIARAAGAPFLAAASPQILGCECLKGAPDPRQWQPDATRDQLWQALRRTTEAGWLSLALPRFLLRLPYGEGTDATERFDFEEMPGPPEHEHYLWGNPVFACLALLGEGFSEYGWEFRPDAYHDVERLPLHLYKERGESTLQPCGEALITERAAQAIVEKGLMLFISMKDSDRIRLLRFQNISDPPGAVAGRWG